MNVKEALIGVQYTRTWEVWGRGPWAKAEARYVQSTERTYILRDQGWIYISNGEDIGNWVMEYCRGMGEDHLKSCVEEAIEEYLSDLRSYI